MKATKQKNYKQSIINHLKNYIKDEPTEKKIIDNIFDNINVITIDKFEMTKKNNDLIEKEKKLTEELQNIKMEKKNFRIY